VNPNVKTIVFVSIIAATAILLLLFLANSQKPIMFAESVGAMDIDISSVETITFDAGKTDIANVESTTVDTEKTVLENRSIRYIFSTNDVIRMDETLADIVAESLASATGEAIITKNYDYINDEWVITSRTNTVYKKRIRVNPEWPEIAEFVRIANENIKNSGMETSEEGISSVVVEGGQIVVTYQAVREGVVQKTVFEGGIIRNLPLCTVMINATTKEVNEIRNWRTWGRTQTEKRDKELENEKAKRLEVYWENLGVDPNL